MPDIYGLVSTAQSVSATARVSSTNMSSSHSLLLNRDAADQHPISSITDLSEILSGIDKSLATIIDDWSMDEAGYLYLLSHGSVVVGPIGPFQSGDSGTDGITPHIGANGNWWIGEEDTGVSAGATDEQISSAVEEYLEENPLVKTVNGTEPDENGNVELEIPSGGGGGGGSSGGVFRVTATMEKDSKAYDLKLPVKLGKIVQFNLHCIPKLSGESKVEMYTGGMNYRVIGTLTSNTKAFNIYGVQYYYYGQQPGFSCGIASSASSENGAHPQLPGTAVLVDPNFDKIQISTTVDGIVLQAGTRLEMWGVYTP